MTQVEPEVPSEPTPRRSRSPMQVVAERRVADSNPATTPTTLELTPGVPRTTSPPPTNAQTSSDVAELQARAAWKRGVLGAINVLALVLAGRVLVLVAIAGAIFLTWLSLGNPDPYRLTALGIYCAAVVMPCVWLASQGR